MLNTLRHTSKFPITPRSSLLRTWRRAWHCGTATVPASLARARVCHADYWRGRPCIGRRGGVGPRGASRATITASAGVLSRIIGHPRRFDSWKAAQVETHHAALALGRHPCSGARGLKCEHSTSWRGEQTQYCTHGGAMIIVK